MRRYAASLAALSDDDGDGGRSRERGIAWGTEVGQAVLAWRATDGFNGTYPAFNGGQRLASGGRHRGWCRPAHLRDHERAGLGLHLDVRSRERRLSFSLSCRAGL